MADDGVTQETEKDEPSTDEANDAEEADSSDAESSDQPEDAVTCDECGAPMTSEVVDFKVASSSTWEGMGGAGEVQYRHTCTNEDCPTNQPDTSSSSDTDSDTESDDESGDESRDESGDDPDEN